MRGSALRAPGGEFPPPLPRGLAGAFRPVHPDQEEALPLCGTPASEPFSSDTSDRRVHPLGTRAQGALLPETPAWTGGTAPFPHYPRIRCVTHL
jgi:hypothetical protein